MNQEQFEQLLAVLNEVNRSLLVIASTKTGHKTGFDSKLAPKVINIERCGEGNANCLSFEGKALPYRSITGILDRISLESGTSSNWGSYTLVFLWLATDDGLICLKCGMLPKPSVSLRNVLYGLKQLPDGKQLITLEFTPNLGTTELDKKVVNVGLRDRLGNEIKTAFPKEKGTDRDTTEIQEYWQQTLLTVIEKLSVDAVDINPAKIIEAIDVEMQRLGWTAERGQKYLVQKYGKRSRHLLTDGELTNFLNQLKNLQTVEQR